MENGSKNRSGSYRDKRQNKVVKHYADPALKERCYGLLLKLYFSKLPSQAVSSSTCSFYLQPKEKHQWAHYHGLNVLVEDETMVAEKGHSIAHCKWEDGNGSHNHNGSPQWIWNTSCSKCLCPRFVNHVRKHCCYSCRAS